MKIRSTGYVLELSHEEYQLLLDIMKTVRDASEYAFERTDYIVLEDSLKDVG